MSEAVSVIVGNAEAFRNAMVQGFNFGRHVIENTGRTVEILVRECDEIGTRQRGYYHGYVLATIAAYAQGGQFSLQTWKEYFRQLYLGSEWREFTDPMTGEITPREVRLSTEDLGVRKYAELIDKVMAYAATELGIEWEYRSREEWEQSGQMRRAA